MQKYKEKAIPLIIIDSNESTTLCHSEYIFGEEAQSILSSTVGKIAIVAVAGMYRTGKSYLLNRMLLNRSDGFGVGPTINPCTKGLWMWARPIVHRTVRDQILNVFIVDSEGLGACDQDNTHDSKIFALTMLLSSCFIYNSMGSIDENAIGSLGLVVNLGNFLKTKINGEPQQNESEQFSPQFFWVVRDFSLQLINREGKQIDGRDYLENALTMQTEKGIESIDTRNAVRKAIKQYFPKRDCITLVRPLTNQQNLQMLDKMQFDSLRPEFVEQVLALRKSIFGSLKSKSLKGKTINGKMYCDLVISYIEAINSGGVPVIENTWKYICRNECEKALEESVDFLEACFSQRIRKKLPLSEQQVKKLRNQIFKEVEDMFYRLTPNNQLSVEYKQALLAKAQARYQLIKQENENQNIKAAQTFLASEFEYIDKRAKNNEYKRISEYVKELQLFYEYYRKKCSSQPSKAQVFVLEFLIKRFADTAVIMAKHSYNETDSIKIKLKEVETKAQKSIAEINERTLREKTQLTQKILILETGKKELTEFKEQLQGEVQRTRKDMQSVIQERLSTEATLKREATKIQTQLRAQVQNLEHIIDEKSKQHSQIVSVLQKDSMLLQNKYDYTQKNLAQSQSRYKEMETSLRSVKADFERALKEADRKTETLKSTLQLKISKLEMTLEERNGEVARLQQNNTDLNQAIEDIDRKFKQAREETEVLLRRVRQQASEDRELEMEKVKRDHQQTINELTKKQRKLENDLSSKDSNSKMLKLELEKETALLTQKLQFCESELREKSDRMQKMNQDYESLMGIISLKDEQIVNAQSRMTQTKELAEKAKRQFESELSHIKRQLEETKFKLEESTQLLNEQRDTTSMLKEQKQTIYQNNNRLIDQIKSIESSRSQTLLQREVKFQEQIKRYESQLETEKQQGRLRVEQIKRNAESSLVQLKNFYQIERERLQKRLLEERRRLEQVESQALQVLALEYSNYKEATEDQMTTLNQTIKQTSSKLRQTQQQLTRQLDQAKISIDQLTKDKSMTLQQYEYKQSQLKEQLRRVQKQQEDERATFLRKVEAITYQMSKKQKQLLQLQTRREASDSQLHKKQQLMQDLQKQYNDELQHLTQRAQEFRSKYITLKDEFMELKIQSEKEIALTKQKNEFLTSKVAELIKQREINSAKNLMDRPSDRADALKQQVERLTQEITAIESKFDKAKKTAKDTQVMLAKQLTQLERQKTLLTERLYLTEERNKQLESRTSSRGQQHMKDIEQMRDRYSLEKEVNGSENQKLRSQLILRESQYDELYSRHQRDIALSDEKIKFIDYQKDQLKRQLEDNRRKLQLAMTQLQRRDQSQQEQELKRKTIQLEKKYASQLQSMREMLKKKSEEADESTARLRVELRTAKERNSELQEKLLRGEKSKRSDELLLQQNEQLKKERDELFLSHKAEIAKENEQNRRKVAQIEKKYKTIEKKNAEFNFLLEKEHAKWIMQKDTLVDRITELEEALKEKSFLERSVELQKNSAQTRKASLDRRKSPQELSSSEFKKSNFFDLKLL